eukprot:g82512.t1
MVYGPGGCKSFHYFRYGRPLQMCGAVTIGVGCYCSNLGALVYFLRRNGSGGCGCCGGIRAGSSSFQELGVSPLRQKAQRVPVGSSSRLMDVNYHMPKRDSTKEAGLIDAESL